MSTAPAKDVQIAAWPARRATFVTIGACALICFGLTYFGPRWHPKGEEAKPDAATVNWAILLTFLPFYGLIPIYLSVRGWKRLKEDRIYRWQAKVMFWGVLILCIVTVLDFGHMTLFAHYSQEIAESGRVKGVLYPRDMTFAWRAQELFSYVTFFLIILMSTGFLGSERIEEETNQATATSDDPPK